MPTYEYQCRSCAQRFEARQSIMASPRTRCPHCGKKVDRLISAGAGFLFKGSGFYSTDYRSKPYQEAAKKDTPRRAAARYPFLGVLPRKVAQAKKWRHHMARTREIEGGGIRVVAPETVGCCQWGDHWTDAPVVEG